MGGCAAPFCNNSSSKGYIMKIFPRDPARRAAWAVNVPRANWKPTNNSFLCEVHFAPDMWEPGRNHKLKRDAIPTIFGFFFKKQGSKDIECDGSTKNNIDKITNINNTVELMTSDVKSSEHKTEKMDTIFISNTSEHITHDVKHEVKNMETVIISDTSERTTDNEHKVENMETSIIHDTNEPTFTNISSESKPIQSDENKIEKYEKLVKIQQLRLITMSKKIKALQSAMRELKSKMDADNLKTAVSAIFNEDQLRALRTKKRIRNWSNVTLQRAFRLKFLCGTNGYEEILRQGIPLPNERTLRRQLGKI